MRMSATLGTRVARRVLGLFLLCALLPVALTIGVSYRQIQSALVEERIAQLGQAAEGYGTTLLERLHLADQLARSLTVAPESAAASRQSLGQHFRAAVFVVPGEARRAVLGDGEVPADVLAAASDPRVGAGEPTLRTPTAADGTCGVWLVRAWRREIPRWRPRRRALPTFLWGTADELPFLTELCVLDASRAPCIARRRCRLRSTGFAHGSRPGGRTLQRGRTPKTASISSFREVFLKPFCAELADRHEPARGARARADPRASAARHSGGGARPAARSLPRLVQVRRTMDAGTPTDDEATARRDFGARLPADRADDSGELRARSPGPSGWADSSTRSARWRRSTSVILSKSTCPNRRHRAGAR
jgi:hypothetical protein